jgi:hypothetical protein
MMAVVSDLRIVDSDYQAAARCLVCGNGIDAGEGVTALLGDRILRFKCPGCLTRFEADPERYLAGHEAGCCGDEHATSPASEWRCD